MATRTKSKPATSRRDLVEQIAVGVPEGASPLRVDEDRGVIFRVKVLGRFSRNNHGLTEAENGSDYAPCMRRAIQDYEGKKVKCNHPADRTQPGKERPVEDTFGVLRNVVMENDESGEPALWADLHCLTSHPMFPRVVEDVKKGLGVYGLSHNAASRRERFDRGAKRLVIEELAVLRSVDLVDKPATNRNLWESEERTMSTTLRNLLESRRTKWSKNRRKWCDLLLEDDAMAPAMDAPAEVGDGGDEDDALWTGFKAAIDKLFEKYAAGEMDAKEVGKNVVEYLKAHGKLTGSDEPEAPPAEKSESDDDDDKPKDKQESEAEKKLAGLEAREKARELCESLGVVPTTLQVKAVAGLSDDKERRQLVESFKGKTAGGFKSPKSGTPGGGAKPDKPRETLESEEEQKAAVGNDLAILRG